MYVLFADTDREVRICIDCSSGRLVKQLRVFDGETINACNHSIALRWRTVEEDEERWRVREEVNREELPWNRLLKLIGVRK